MNKDFFIVKFDNIDDYKFALFEGRWLIFDHYLLVQRWRPLFKPQDTKVQRIAAGFVSHICQWSSTMTTSYMVGGNSTW